MQKLFLLVFFVFSLNVYSQNHFLYKCKDIAQRDSISNDLNKKGYKYYVCDNSEIYINLQDDYSYCYSETLKDYNELSLKDFYSNVFEKLVFEEAEQTESKEDLCSTIEIKTDKFNGEVEYSSPDTNDISFIKYKKKGTMKQYVSISVYDSYLSGYNNIGLTVLFKSGKKIIRSKEKVDVNVSSGSNWRYSVFFTPTINEVNLLKKEEIIAVKLYIFDTDISQGSTIKDYANCILETQKIQSKKR